MGGEYQIWVITDGRAGNVAQAMGLAEAIARTRPATVTQKPVVLKGWAAWIPPALSWQVAGIARWPFSGLVEDSLTAQGPDLIVGAGRRVGPVVAAIRRLRGVASVQLLAPQMPVRAFDAVVVPDHDRVAGPNVLTSTGALNRLTPATVAAAARAWDETFAALPRPRLAVLVGGPSRSSGFGDRDAGALVSALEALSARHQLMITPSRRTPPGLIRALQRAADAGGIWLWDGTTGANPYPGLLGHADAVLVTEDSVNMASEAATTGLPVHIFPVTDPAPKIARFHQSMAGLGASRRFEGRIESWTYQPLAEADRIAAELIKRGTVPS